MKKLVNATYLIAVMNNLVMQVVLARIPLIPIIISESFNDTFKAHMLRHSKVYSQGL